MGWVQETFISKLIHCGADRKMTRRGGMQCRAVDGNQIKMKSVLFYLETVTSCWSPKASLEF